MNKDFILGLGLGLVVGTATLLVTPKSGREVREDIEFEAQKLKSRAELAWEELQIDYQEAVAEVDSQARAKELASDQ